MVEPFVPQGRSDARSRIISALAVKWPLSAKQIHSSVSRAGGRELTYQAIHKSLGELVSEGVLSKSLDGYSLSFSWIDGLSRFSDELKSAYSKDGNLPAGQAVLLFDSVAQVDQFLIDFAGRVFDPKDKVLALQWCHFWVPLFLNRDTYLRMQDLLRYSNSYSITPADTSLDRWCADYWKKHSKLRHRIGVKEATNTDTVAYKDFVLHVHYPIEFRRAIDRVYEKTASMKDFDVDAFYKAVFMKKAKVPVTITRNQALADQLKKETIELCGGRKQ